MKSCRLKSNEKKRKKKNFSYSHHSENVKKMISFFETELENIDFIDLADLKKVSYNDILQLIMSKKRKSYEIKIGDLNDNKTIFDEFLMNI